MIKDAGDNGLDLNAIELEMSAIPSEAATNLPCAPVVELVDYEIVSPEQPLDKKKHSYRPLMVLIIIGLALGVCLGVGIHVVLDDNNEEVPNFHLDPKCITGTKLLRSRSPELREYTSSNMDAWTKFEFGSDDSMTGRVNMPPQASAVYASLCESAAGKLFVIDDATFHCKMIIDGLPPTDLTMDYDHAFECIAKSCDTAEDEAFERAFVLLYFDEIETTNENMGYKLEHCQLAD